MKLTVLVYLCKSQSQLPQGIPHDVDTMHELWGTEYRRRNKYFASACLQTLMSELPEDGTAKADLMAQSRRLLDVYNELSNQYHNEKRGNKNNTLVLD